MELPWWVTSVGAVRAHRGLSNSYGERGFTRERTHARAAAAAVGAASLRSVPQLDDEHPPRAADHDTQWYLCDRKIWTSPRSNGWARSVPSGSRVWKAQEPNSAVSDSMQSMVSGAPSSKCLAHGNEPCCVTVWYSMTRGATSFPLRRFQPCARPPCALHGTASPRSPAALQRTRHPPRGSTYPKRHHTCHWAWCRHHAAGLRARGWPRCPHPLAARAGGRRRFCCASAIPSSSATAASQRSASSEARDALRRCLPLLRLHRTLDQGRASRCSRSARDQT